MHRCARAPGSTQVFRMSMYEKNRKGGCKHPQLFPQIRPMSPPHARFIFPSPPPHLAPLFLVPHAFCPQLSQAMDSNSTPTRKTKQRPNHTGSKNPCVRWQPLLRLWSTSRTPSQYPHLTAASCSPRCRHFFPHPGKQNLHVVHPYHASLRLALTRPCPPAAGACATSRILVAVTVARALAERR